MDTFTENSKWTNKATFFLKFHKKNAKKVTCRGINLSLATQDNGELHINS